MATKSNQSKTGSQMHQNVTTPSPKPTQAVKPSVSKANTGKLRRQKPANWVWIVGLVIVAGVGIVLLWLSQSSSNSQPKPISNVGTSDYHSLAFSPTEPNTVFFGSHSGLLKSRDGGRTWQATSVKGQDAMGLGIAKDGKTIYLGGHSVFMKSEDSGQTWRSLLDKLPSTDVHGLANDPANPSSLYVFVVGAGLFKSSDGGQNWQTIPAQVGNSIMSMAYGNQTLWAGLMDRGVMRSKDGGFTWKSANGSGNMALSGMVSALAFDSSSSVLYAGTGDGLFGSPDGGTSWSKLGYTDGVAAVAVNPSKRQNLLLVRPGGEVYRSEDGGLTWPGK